ncbi:MAG: hypothetical protein FJ279_23910 [Planctomycetes bacterium]|nr:hypothetical protein [Planctomycetota bacterium]
MTDVTLDKVWQSVRELTPGEQRQLRERLERSMAQQDEAAKIKTFHQALLAAGLVKTIKRPLPDRSGPRELIKVKGKPLSETILNDAATEEGLRVDNPNSHP